MLGNCPGGNSAFASAYPNIVINEVTTIAAAYAFGGFATDATHVSSSGTTLAQTGIANAFANAGNLANITTGNAYATTPTTSSNGTVPQSEINTLANVLASCINTNGAVTGPTNPTACYTLLTDTLSGGTTGTQPTDTATAAINMAHPPGATIAALYALSNATPPFAPALSTQPRDFSVAVSYKGGGLSSPNGVAIDGAGNAWISNYGGNSVTEFFSLGAPSSGSPYTGGGLFEPIAIAVDDSGDTRWIGSGRSVLELNRGGYEDLRKYGDWVHCRRFDGPLRNCHRRIGKHMGSEWRQQQRDPAHQFRHGFGQFAVHRRGHE